MTIAESALALRGEGEDAPAAAADPMAAMNVAYGKWVAAAQADYDSGSDSEEDEAAAAGGHDPIVESQEMQEALQPVPKMPRVDRSGGMVELQRRMGEIRV